MQLRGVEGRLFGWTEHGPVGAPPALFIHPMLGRAGMWQPVWDGLPGRHLVAPDLPGHGRTDHDISRDLQEQAVVDALSLIGDQPVDLVGHSFGGTVALRIALQHPELVRSLTLIEPVYFVLLRDAGHPAYLSHLRESQSLSRALAQGDHDAAARAFVDEWGAVPSDEIGPKKWREIVSRIHLVELSQNATMNARNPERVRLGQLADLRMPVQLIEGGQSPAVIHAIGDVIAEACPGIVRNMIADAGHMLTVTHPDVVSGLISSFWRGISEVGLAAADKGAA